MPTKKKRSGKDVEMMPKGELLAKMNGMNEQERAFIAFLYLSGCRISEVLGNKSKRNPTKPIVRHQLEVQNYNGKKLLIINKVPTLKRKLVYRNIPVVVDRERDMLRMLVDYANGLNPEQPLFTFSRITAWRIINKHLGLFPHYFRHLRNTHLVTKYGFSAHELQQYNGWTNSRPSDFYVHLNWRDLAKKMIG